MIRVRLIKTLNEEDMPIGRTGSAEKWDPPGMVMVHWDFGPSIAMYYNELELID
jgi:hypothetical protein